MNNHVVNFKGEYRRANGMNTFDAPAGFVMSALCVGIILTHVHLQAIDLFSLATFIMP